MPEELHPASLLVNPTVNEILQPQFCTAFAKDATVSLATDCGLIEARLCLAGSLCVWGVERNVLEGDTAASKKSFLSELDAAPFVKLVTDHGFFARLTEGELLIVPGKFAFVYVTVEEFEGLRWHLLGDEKRQFESIEYLDFFATTTTSYYYYY